MNQLSLIELDGRKRRGAYFTPQPLARFLCDWAIRGASDRVLEPSCGEAAFLHAAARRLVELGGLTDDSLTGIELDGPSADRARAALETCGVPAIVRVGDFFDTEPSASWDVVVGNPPYVRYQTFAGAARAKGQRAALAAGVRIDGLASSWAPFLVHATRFMKPGGRLGLVLPAELLHVNYAGPVRRFLMERFASVTVVTFETLVFPEVSAGVVLLLAEGEGPTDFITLRQVGDLEDLLHSAIPDQRWCPPEAEEKWSAALLPAVAQGVMSDLLRTGAFVPLEDWGRPYLGSVTGANRYFTMTLTETAKLGLMDHVLRISPPGSKHLRGGVLTKSALDEMDRDGLATCLFSPTGQDEAVASYLEHGVSGGVPDAYKCRVRDPWWRVPLAPTPDLLFTYMSHALPRLVANRAGVRIINSVHGLKLKAGIKTLGMSALPVGSLNSATWLSAEMVGRSYGGGVLKLEPREASKLLVPSPALLTTIAEGLAGLPSLVGPSSRKSDWAAAVRTVDETVLIRGAGLRRSQVGALSEARDEFFRRRTHRRNI